MIVHNLDILGTAINPPEADAPLIVDPDRPLTAPVTPQGFQPIARRGVHFADRRNSVQLQKLAACDALERPEFPDIFVFEQALRPAAGKRPDHAASR
jgi:hypothetical protein